MIDLDNGTAFAEELRGRFKLDFVALSIESYNRNTGGLSWQCASGNTNSRFRRIFLPSGVGVLGTVYETRSPLLIRSVEDGIAPEDRYQYPVIAAEGLESLAAFPLYRGRNDDLVAIIVCASRTSGTVTPELLESIGDFTERQTGFFVPRKEFREPQANRSSSLAPGSVTHRILRAQEEERLRIARELHDGLAQELLVVQIELRKYKYLPEGERQQAVERASALLGECLTHLSGIAANLRPPALDELGLPAAMVAHCSDVQRSFGLKVVARIDEVRPVQPEVALGLYRIFQEAVSNACKYSRSDSLTVDLQQSGDTLSLVVRDFGLGFDTEHPDIAGGGLGLVGMRERAEAIGGRLTVESTPGRGTVVSVSVRAKGAL